MKMITLMQTLILDILISSLKLSISCYLYYMSRKIFYHLKNELTKLIHFLKYCYLTYFFFHHLYLAMDMDFLIFAFLFEVICEFTKFFTQLIINDLS